MILSFLRHFAYFAGSLAVSFRKVKYRLQDFIHQEVPSYTHLYHLGRLVRVVFHGQEEVSIANQNF